MVLMPFNSLIFTPGWREGTSKVTIKLLLKPKVTIKMQSLSVYMYHNRLDSKTMDHHVQINLHYGLPQSPLHINTDGNLKGLVQFLQTFYATIRIKELVKGLTFISLVFGKSSAQASTLHIHPILNFNKNAV